MGQVKSLVIQWVLHDGSLPFCLSDGDAGEHRQGRMSHTFSSRNVGECRQGRTNRRNATLQSMFIRLQRVA